MKDKLISVIIPTYNRGSVIGRTIDSVLNQTYTNIEIIIVDDGSTDNTEKIVNSYKDNRIDYIKTNNWGGPARPRNIGLKSANGDYVSFLDSDDWWADTKLEESIIYLQNGADLVYHDLFIIDKLPPRKKYLKKLKSRQLSAPVFKDLIMNGNTICTSSVLVKKEIIEKVNGFSEIRSLIAIEDYDAWLRIANISNNFKKINKTLGFYWAGGGNISSYSRLIKNYEVISKRFVEFTKDDLTSRLLEARVNYYKAILEIENGNLRIAQKTLKTHSNINIKYFSVFILSLFGRRFFKYIHKLMGKI